MTALRLSRCVLVLLVVSLTVPSRAEDRPAVHPLDPLSAPEISATRKALKGAGHLTESRRFAMVALQEPPKAEVLGHQTGAGVSRRSFSVLYDSEENKTYEAVVDVRDPDAPRIVSFEHKKGAQPLVIDSEFDEVPELIRASPEWKAALARRNIDPDDVELDVWTHGIATPQPSERTFRAMSYLRGDDVYFWGRVIEGLEAIVTPRTGKVEILDRRKNENLPVPAFNQNLDEASIAQSLGGLREAPKPLTITQPEGPSFTIRGHEVEWQKWRFRYAMHPREGLVLYQVGYEDKGKVRPILYRASFSEMAVPYGDPSGGWNWRSAFDVGEYGVGKDADPIVPDLDAPTNVVTTDEVLANENGRPRVHPAVVGFYERDAGILWKHVELVDGEAVDETRRARELVAFFVTTVGNYDYTISWIFHQDGSLEVETGLSGIMLPQGVKDGAHEPPSAHLVAPNVAAPHHQHILSFRLDFDVDGPKNTVMEMNTSGRPMDPASNPNGNAIVMQETALPSEKQAQRDINLASARTWRVINRGVLNSLQHPVGFILVPGANSLPFLDPQAPARKRAGFMEHHVWVTRYRDGELYAAGDYPNQQAAAGKGLPEWTANDEPLDDQDVVVWYTLNVTHIPRPEEWPVMSNARYGFKLLPGGFFVGNPALDVPRP